MSAGLIGGIAVAGAGLIFCIIAIPFFIKEKTLMKKCTSRTTGQVVKYKYGGGDAMWVSPVVEFEVGGKKYSAYRHYKGSARGSNSKPVIDPETGKELPFYIDEKEVFHRQITRIKLFQSNEEHNIKKVGEIWPIGSSMTVLYNPDKPKQAFVDKVVTISKIAGIVLLSCGGGFIALGTLMGFLLR